MPADVFYLQSTVSTLKLTLQYHQVFKRFEKPRVGAGVVLPWAICNMNKLLHYFKLNQTNFITLKNVFKVLKLRIMIELVSYLFALYWQIFEFLSTQLK